jgi:colanic acid biosynthesis glycosyl transferase WcaI
MKIQLWSYNYAPEPTGIGPVSATWARAMQARGHEISVVAAHPHYPEPAWGKHVKPTRTDEDGVTVVRLPLIVGRDSTFARIRQDASFSAALLAARPFLPKADVRVVVSPCFPALTVALASAALDRKRWLLWIQDILPDGAIGTGLVDESSAYIRASRRLERAAYRSADRIAVISRNFEANLLAKGVPQEKLCRIYNPATLPAAAEPRNDFADRPTVLVMGNIGHSQGLAEVVRRFEASDELNALGARLVITGTGVATDEVRAQIVSDRVEMRGVVSNEELLAELAGASVGLVAQTPELPEFNFPSKLMNYLGSALPVVGFVAPGSEVEQVLTSSGTGWALDNAAPERLGSDLARILGDREALLSASRAAHFFALEQLTDDALASQFERALDAIV